MAGSTIIVDGYNVVGATADGWWRDRPAAVERLARRLARYAAHTGDAVTLVLDAAQPGFPGGDHDGVEVVVARRRGRDAADDRVRELLAERPAEGVLVVTSDRALRQDAVAAGAAVVGAGTFLARLDRAGC